MKVFTKRRQELKIENASNYDRYTKGIETTVYKSSSNDIIILLF